MNNIKKLKCGFVAMVGRPNVGKSTLLNHIMGQKVSIVTSKPQTTRNRVLAVHNTDTSQIVFLDTPGIHKPIGSLGHYMNEAADGAIMEADVCVWLIDAADQKRQSGLTGAEIAVAKRFADHGVKAIAVLNKTDILKPKEKLLPMMAEVSELENIEEIIPVSAKTGEGIDILMTEIHKRLPESDQLFPEDMLSDKADRFFVSEFVREALTVTTTQEIPYKTAVVIDKFVEESEQIHVMATIHVERDSQKGIIIGKGGTKLKEIGIAARAEAEKMLGCKVNLMLHVNVTADWTTNPAGLQKMGYE